MKLQGFLAVVFTLSLGAVLALNNDVGKWRVKDCILAQLELQIKVLNNATDANATVISFALPASANATGNCGNSSDPDQTQNIVLDWFGDSTNDTHLSREVQIKFGKKETFYGVQRLSGRFVLARFSMKNQYNKTHNISSYVSFDTDEVKDLMFHVPKEQSYLCNDTGAVPMKTIFNFHNDTSGKDWQQPVTIVKTNATFTNIQFDAFLNGNGKNSTDFRTPMDCAYSSNDIVPIIVGLALAALVIGILVAYLIGRKRARQRGYESV